jgi:hypothetical protein
MITIKHDLARLERSMERIQKQIPFASALALTRTAQAVQEAEIKEMASVFDRPTPWTLGGTFLVRATKQNQTAIVGIKDQARRAIPPAKYLTPQILGGTRRAKRFERGLRAAGVLPPGWLAVPGAAAKLDEYGNMSRGQIVELISYFGGFAERGFRANATDASRRRRDRREARRTGAQASQFFVVKPGDGGLKPGIWQRHVFGSGTSVRPIMIFIPHATYRRLFDFYGVGARTIRERFGAEFHQAFQHALATAR